MHKIDSSANASDTEPDSPIMGEIDAGTAKIRDWELRLFSAARFFAAEAEHAFTLPCSTIVRDLVRAGLHTMNKQNRLGASDYEEAEANLERLVMVMVENARKNKDPIPKPLIREGDFVAAKRLCPIWPFC